jgi:hypothetical protein
VVSTKLGSNAGSLSDDTVFFGKDGTIKGESGVTPWTRSYDSTKEGPLRNHHGSDAPDTGAISAAELAKLRASTPGTSLDEASKIFGGPGGFEKMANSKEFYDTSAQFWEGKCHAWTWSSLNAWIDTHVDVNGPEGGKGLWIGGQWMSRADLGNWMMATADHISVNENAQLFAPHPGAEDLVKATTQFMMNKGGGVIADVYNDKKHNNEYQVWNQPFVSAAMDTTTLTGDTAKKILDIAKADGATGTTVKKVAITGTYGVEASDDYEGPSNQTAKNWNVYVVTDASGKMVKAYMADDDKLKNVSGLPTNYSDETPDYFWKPSGKSIDDVLAGRSNSTVDSDALGPQFKFFIGTVLAKGVTGETRTAFEKAVKALPAGQIPADKAAALVNQFKGVANAYSPEQWQATFGSRGLDKKLFGAAY